MYPSPAFFTILAGVVSLAAVLCAILRFRQVKRQRQVERERDRRRKQLAGSKARTRLMFNLLMVKATSYGIDFDPVPHWPEDSTYRDDRTAEVVYAFSFRQGMVVATFYNTGLVTVRAWDFTPREFNSDSDGAFKGLDEYMTLALRYQPPEASTSDDADTSMASTTAAT